MSIFLQLATIQLAVKKWRNVLVHLRAITSETCTISHARICDRKPEVLGIFEAERIIAKKICSGKPLFMLKWQRYCSSQNTWEPNVCIPPIDLVFERGMKVPLQYEESI